MRPGRLHCGESGVAERIGVAETWAARLRGLLFRPPLSAEGLQGLLLRPCSSVHTIGMRYPLDVVFLDRDGAVLAVREHIGPWRACTQRGAHAVLELRAGMASVLGIRPGEVLEWRPA